LFGKYIYCQILSTLATFILVDQNKGTAFDRSGILIGVAFTTLLYDQYERWRGLENHRRTSGTEGQSGLVQHISANLYLDKPIRILNLTYSLLAIYFHLDMPFTLKDITFSIWRVMNNVDNFAVVNNTKFGICQGLDFHG